ncbi:hypothetical protein B0H19DRAFT_1247775 [Mycena capillaripes]|nr:hypothetical protein B0H19DRAFT_1247775 [Mycena capillaripes]
MSELAAAAASFYRDLKQFGKLRRRSPSKGWDIYSARARRKPMSRSTHPALYLGCISLTQQTQDVPGRGSQPRTTCLIIDNRLRSTRPGVGHQPTGSRSLRTKRRGCGSLSERTCSSMHHLGVIGGGRYRAGGKHGVTPERTPRDVCNPSGARPSAYHNGVSSAAHAGADGGECVRRQNEPADSSDVPSTSHMPSFSTSTPVNNTPVIPRALQYTYTAYLHVGGCDSIKSQPQRRARSSHTPAAGVLLSYPVMGLLLGAPVQDDGFGYGQNELAWRIARTDTSDVTPDRPSPSFTPAASPIPHPHAICRATNGPTACRSIAAAANIARVYDASIWVDICPSYVCCTLPRKSDACREQKDDMEPEKRCEATPHPNRV